MYSYLKTTVILLLICLCSYLNILHVPFQFDGVRYIKENRVISGLVDRHEYEYYFWQFSPTNIFNRPILNYTYTLNYYLGKDNAFGYNLIDLLIHFGVTLFVYLILRKITQNTGDPRAAPTSPKLNLPLVAALLFASHPVQTQTVAYSMSRSASLCTFLYLASFYCFLLAIKFSPTTGKKSLFPFGMIFLSILLMRLAFGVKLIIISLPPIMITYFCLFSPYWETVKSFISKKRLLFTLAVALLSIFAIYELILFKEGAFLVLNDPGSIAHSRLNYLLSQVKWSVFYYLKILLFPFNLNLDPDVHMVRSFADSGLIAAILVLALLVAFIKNQSRLVIFGFLWMIVSMAPESSFIPLLDLVAEHRLYLPAVGFVLIVSSLLASRKWVPLHIALILFLAVNTMHRNEDWISEKSLWRDSSIKSPHKWRTYSNYARALDIEGDKELSVINYKKAISIDPNHFELHHNLGNIYLDMGNCDMAIEEHEKALRLSPYLPESLFSIGKCHKMTGNYDKAIRYYKNALELAPAMDAVYRELGLLYYFNLDDKKTGAFYLREAVRRNPSYPQNASIMNLLEK